jgi:hypothetical protein
MRDPFIITPDIGTRKRMAAHRAKWKAAWAHRSRMTKEELEAEELRLEAEKLAFLARRDGMQDAA